MLTTFASISPHLKFKSKLVSVDNLAFKFHYRATFLILLVCTILVTSRQYIGEHIRCITGGSIPDHVINTFCFFTTTFTVVKHYNESMLNRNLLPHPGVGPHLPEDTLKHHAYYQWVPFFLFAQSILFYIPHLLWRSWEGGKIKALVDGLQRIALSQYLDDDIQLHNGNRVIPSKSTTDRKLTTIRIAFRHHFRINNYWATKLIICELLNFVNILFQIYITNRFLGGSFLRLGYDFLHDDFQGKMDVLDMVFPKVTKCDFFKYGPSGSIQKHDALCVMALNVINEKIFTFLWFWYALLLGVSSLALLWRGFTLVFHSKSAVFNGMVFSTVCPGRLNPWDMLTVTNEFAFSDWLFLYYLAKNMEPFLFREMLIKIAKELRGEDTPDSSDSEENYDGNANDEDNDDDDDDQSNPDSFHSYKRNDLEKLQNLQNYDTIDRARNRETLVKLLNEKDNTNKIS